MNTRTTALHTAIVALTMTLGACATPQQTTSPEQRAETRGSSELEPGDGVASSEAREVKLIVEAKREDVVVHSSYITLMSGAMASTEMEVSGKRRWHKPSRMTLRLVPTVAANDNVIVFDGDIELRSRGEQSSITLDDRVAPGSPVREVFQLDQQTYTLVVTPSLEQG